MQDQEFAHYVLRGSAIAGLTVASLFAVVTIASTGTVLLTPLASVGTTQSAAVVGANVVPPPTPPTQGAPQGSNTPQLTQSQLQAVAELLQSDGVGSSTISRVEAVLQAPPPPTPPPCVSFLGNLSPGSIDANTGGEVTQLQTYLGVSPTGYFGSQTQQAVQNWQSEHGIVASGTPQTTGFGVIGPRTRALMGCLAPGASPQREFQSPPGSPPMPPPQSSSTPAS